MSATVTLEARHFKITPEGRGAGRSPCRRSHRGNDEKRRLRRSHSYLCRPGNSEAAQGFPLSHKVRSTDVSANESGPPSWHVPERAGNGPDGAGWSSHTRRAGENDSAAAPRNVTRAGETRTLHGRHHRPLEVGVYVDVLGLLRGHRRRGDHQARGLHLGRHVRPLGRRGVLRVLQGQQGLQRLLLEQAPDGLLLGRRRRRRWRLRLRRGDQSWRVRMKTTKKTNAQQSTFGREVEKGYCPTDLRGPQPESHGSQRFPA